MDIKALGASQLLGLGQTMTSVLDKSVLQLHFLQKIAGESILEEEGGGACQCGRAGGSVRNNSVLCIWCACSC